MPKPGILNSEIPKSEISSAKSKCITITCYGRALQRNYIHLCVKYEVKYNHGRQVLLDTHLIQRNLTVQPYVLVHVSPHQIQNLSIHFHIGLRCGNGGVWEEAAAGISSGVTHFEDRSKCLSVIDDSLGRGWPWQLAGPGE